MDAEEVYAETVALHAHIEELLGARLSRQCEAAERQAVAAERIAAAFEDIAKVFREVLEMAKAVDLDT